jgi:hypothetical protein
MSNLASTGRAQLRYVPESVFGVTPVTGNHKALRFAGESFDFALSKEVSKEIRADRQLTGAVTVDATSSGDINFHMQYAEYDPILEALMMSTFTTYGTAGVGAAFSAAYTATTITALVAPSGASDFTTLQRGQWFRVNHPTNANHGKVLRVSLTVDPTTTVITLNPSTPATVAASQSGCALQSSRLTNGVLEQSFTVEKQFTDVGQVFAYRGQYVSKASLKFASGALLEGSFSFMGKDAINSAVTTLPGTTTPSQTYEIQNSVTGVGNLWEGGSPLSSTYIKSLDLMADNNLRNQGAIANLGPVGIGVGDFAATGSFQAYFANGVLFQKFKDDVYTSINVSCQDLAGNGYVFSYPRVMLMTCKVVAPGKNGDVMADFTFTAYADDANASPALRKTLFIDRLGSAVV